MKNIFGWMSLLHKTLCQPFISFHKLFTIFIQFTSSFAACLFFCSKYLIEKFNRSNFLKLLFWELRKKKNDKNNC